MKTISRIFAAAIFAFAVSCTNRTANSEDNTNESHLGTDIDRQSHSKNDSLASPDVPQTATDTAAPESKYNGTEASQQNPVSKP